MARLPAGVGMMPSFVSLDTLHWMFVEVDTGSDVLHSIHTASSGHRTTSHLKPGMVPPQPPKAR